MALILAILLGLCLGQFVRVTPDPALIDFFRRTWTLATEKAPLVKGFATEKIGEAIETTKMGPILGRYNSAFKQIDVEAKTKGVANGTPAA